jgi:hypothetical protein
LFRSCHFIKRELGSLFICLSKINAFSEWWCDARFGVAIIAKQGGKYAEALIFEMPCTYLSTVC